MAKSATHQSDMDKASAHQRAGRVELAIALYRTIIAADPRHAEASKMLAIALFQSGDAVEAEQRARAAVALKPNAVDAVNLLASLLGQLGRYDEAARTLRPFEARLTSVPGA